MTYGSRALHAGYLRLKTRTENVRCLLLVHCNIDFMNAPQCYLIVQCLSGSHLGSSLKTFTRGKNRALALAAIHGEQFPLPYYATDK